MLSRVADSVFWMARYLERTDNVLRLLRTDYIASQDEILDFNWQKLTDTLSTEIENPIQANSYREALYHLVLSKDHDRSVFTNILRVRENARSVQDYITKELWQCLNDYYHIIRDPQTENLLIEQDPVTALDMLLRESIIFYGTVEVTMNRGDGYTFLNLGKYIERSLQTLDMLELKWNAADEVTEPISWKYLLYALSGFEFHTKVYKNALQTEDVIHQVIFNNRFPHSVIYSLSQIERYFQRLKESSQPENFKEMEFLAGKMVKDIQYSTLDMSDPVAIKALVNTTRKQILNFSHKLTTLYFGYS
jgi:uncharacterized alpha-E superfamily protein